MGMLQIGPLHIKYEWLIILGAAVITYLVVRKMLTNTKFQKEFVDVILNTAIIVFLLYKFSLVLFRPKILAENPMTILYLNGGTKGLVLAIILAVLYVFWEYKRKKWIATDFWQGIIFSGVSFLLSFWLLRTLFILFL